MLVARPPAGPLLRGDFSLLRAERREFSGPAEFLADPDNRAQVSEYLADVTGSYAREQPADLSGALGQSYGEMAQALIEPIVPADEPVDLLILAFAVHDVRPGRQTAAYLSHITPGAPTAFTICDQGSAAAFSGLRIAREYAALDEIRRVLLVVVEQAALPYDCPVPLPAAHQGVAMLFGKPAASTPARRGRWQRTCAAAARGVGVRQHGGVPPADVADLAAADLAELTGDRGEVRGGAQCRARLDLGAVGGRPRTGIVARPAVHGGLVGARRRTR